MHVFRTHTSKGPRFGTSISDLDEDGQSSASGGSEGGWESGSQIIMVAKASAIIFLNIFLISLLKTHDLQRSQTLNNTCVLIFPLARRLRGSTHRHKR